MWTIPSIYQFQIFKKKYLKKKEEWTGAKKYIEYHMNAQQQIPVPYGSMLHIPLTNLLLLAAKQESYKKSLSLKEKY